MNLLLSLALASTVAGQKPITENQAIRIVATAMRRLDPLPPQCLWYDTEGRSKRAFEIAVYENHGRGCPGDPQISPVVERFRVMRSPVSVWQWDPFTDDYHQCRFVGARTAVCPE
jgi:hypothetical protein